jgi:phenylpropionate dioxygenase-like ring-hydroxylating dioxygenase large terminal subunit
VIGLYRDKSLKVYALEDCCSHAQVKLSHRQVVNNQLECAYHGWSFNSEAECTAVPYLAANQKLPNSEIRHYPVKEQDGFIWLFPSDIEPSLGPLSLPEW